MSRVGEDPLYADRRKQMVKDHLRTRGIRDPAVLAAMATVARQRFVPEDLVSAAYDDCPLPIDEDQTISQPYIVARMVEALQLGDESRVLEVGAGSGYGAAILSQVAGEVITIERHESLADRARRALDAADCDNVRVVHGDGSLGFADRAPYDGIAVTASCRAIPKPLLQQMAEGGRMVVPVGRRSWGQQLIRVVRHGDRYDEEDLGAVRFVPLIGSG